MIVPPHILFFWFFIYFFSIPINKQRFLFSFFIVKNTSLISAKAMPNFTKRIA